MKHKSKNWKCYYIISFEIISYKDRLNQISRRIGIRPSKGSCDIGELRGGKRTKYSWWRWFTELPENSTFDQHLDYLILNMEKAGLFKKGVLKKEYKASVLIAKFFNTKEIAAPGFQISKAYIDWLSKRNVSLELISYPCKP